MTNLKPNPNANNYYDLKCKDCKKTIPTNIVVAANSVWVKTDGGDTDVLTEGYCSTVTVYCNSCLKKRKEKYRAKRLEELYGEQYDLESQSMQGKLSGF